MRVALLARRVSCPLARAEHGERHENDGATDGGWQANRARCAPGVFVHIAMEWAIPPCAVQRAERGAADSLPQRSHDRYAMRDRCRVSQPPDEDRRTGAGLSSLAFPARARGDEMDTAARGGSDRRHRFDVGHLRGRGIQREWWSAGRSCRFRRTCWSRSARRLRIHASIHRRLGAPAVRTIAAAVFVALTSSAPLQRSCSSRQGRRARSLFTEQRRERWLSAFEVKRGDQKAASALRGYGHHTIPSAGTRDEALLIRRCHGSPRDIQSFLEYLSRGFRSRVEGNFCGAHRGHLVYSRRQRIRDRGLCLPALRGARQYPAPSRIGCYKTCAHFFVRADY